MKECRSTYFNTKIILNALDSQVLAQRPELVVNVLVVGLPVGPFRLKHFQGLHEHGLWAHFARVRGLGQSEVRLLNSHASSLYKLSYQNQLFVRQVKTFLVREKTKSQ